MKKYVSSIVNKYGDTEKVPSDCKALYDIINRQGHDLLIDCIAENCGETANKFKLNTQDRKTLIDSLVQKLSESLKERL